MFCAKISYIHFQNSKCEKEQNFNKRQREKDARIKVLIGTFHAFWWCLTNNSFRTNKMETNLFSNLLSLKWMWVFFCCGLLFTLYIIYIAFRNYIVCIKKWCNIYKKGEKWEQCKQKSALFDVLIWEKRTWLDGRSQGTNVISFPLLHSNIAKRSK